MAGLLRQSAHLGATGRDSLRPMLAPELGRMVVALIAEKGAAERFGPVALTAEVNQRYADG